MDQNIIQIGNSQGIIIPKKILKELGLSVGSKIRIQEDNESDAIIITKSGKDYPDISLKFLRSLEQVHKKYGKALKELSNN